MKKCFECGGKAEYDHHVVPKSLGGIKTVPLCENCHKKIHGNLGLNIKYLTKKALEKKKSNGEKCGGQCPYGYVGVDTEGKLLVNDGEMKAVERIILLRKEGLTLRKIGVKLEENGLYPRNGHKWHPNTVRHIIKYHGKKKGSFQFE